MFGDGKRQTIKPGGEKEGHEVVKEVLSIEKSFEQRQKT